MSPLYWDMFLPNEKSTQWVSWLLLLSCLGLVCWIRLLPLSLSVVEEWAEESVRRQIAERLAQENASVFSAPDPQNAIQQRTEDWIAHNSQQFAAEKERVAQQLKSQLRFRGEDEKEYVYLGDYDSYVWLRNARNYLRTGTTCDALVNGKCFDTYTHAPVGSEMQYNRSLHIVAIVGLHKVITFFHPHYPLSASAFLVPIFIGALGVLPAFFLGRSVGGDIGGLFAAILSALYHQFLVRSIGSDNDVWNIVLPLFMLWAIFAALQANTFPRQTLNGALGGVVCGLHAVTWQGWQFFYTALFSGFFVSVLLYGCKYSLQQRTLRMWRSTAVRKTTFVWGAFSMTVGICLALAAPQTSFLEPAYEILHPVLSVVDGFMPTSTQLEHASVGAEAETLWPSNFATVIELLRPDFAVIVDSFWGSILFCGSLLGLLLLLLPKAHWRWRQWGVLFSAVGIFSYLVSATPPAQKMAIGLCAAPFVGAGLSLLFDEETNDFVPLGFALSLIFWFLGALFLSYQGIRFLLLLSPPFALGCAVAAGRLFTWGRFCVHHLNSRYGWVADPLLFLLLASLLVDPVQGAHIVASRYVPTLEDAWWGALNKIREESPSDAIINVWWDYGYWAKYVAERRVSNDGGSLRAHIPHWLGRALVTPDESESIGVLRMLNCGSDASPYPEGRFGAYAQVLAAGHDAITAHDMVIDLIRLDRAAAQAYLSRKGFSPAQQANILNATHCTPPESYLLVASEQLLKPNSWMHLGLWDLRRAYIVKQLRSAPQVKAVAELTARFGYSEQQAAELYTRAQTLDSGNEERSFIAPLSGSLSLSWLPCQPQPGSGTMECPIGMAVGREGGVLETFSYRPDAPGESRFHFRYPRESQAEGVTRGETPGVIVWADGQRLQSLALPAPTLPDIGVMVDVPNQRVILGSPLLVQSMLVRLLYLDGRYAEHYEKFDERATYLGTRVVTWKVRWDNPHAAVSSPAALHNQQRPSAPR